MFFLIQIPVTKIIGKTAILTVFCFCVSAPSYTNLEFMFLMQQSHVQCGVQWNLLAIAHTWFQISEQITCQRSKINTWYFDIIAIITDDVIKQLMTSDQLKIHKLLAIHQRVSMPSLIIIEILVFKIQKVADSASSPSTNFKVILINLTNLIK